MLTEVLVILLLLGLNGVFAMTEIAVVSARRSRLRHLADHGNLNARTALELAESPNRFLSTVQIGITLVGILAGAYGGATLAEEIEEGMRGWPALAPYSKALGLILVVLPLTYLSLVLGELLPKRIGLGNPERIALAVARPMLALSRWVHPLVQLLSLSTEALLRLLRLQPTPSSAVTEDEVKGLMQEGLRAGAFNRVESEMVESVLELDRLTVREIMTPRTKIIWIQRTDSHESIWHKIVVSGHSFFPVHDGDRDHVVGVVSVKAIYANLAAGAGVHVPDLMTKPLIVPSSQNVIQLLDTFKESGRHIAMVTDEFGTIVGLVTLNDVMEAIVGDFPSPAERQKPSAKRRADGSWLVDALISIEALQSAIPALRLEPAADPDYQTLAGFVVKQLGHVPKEGETFEWGEFVFEVLDMDRHRVDKVLLLPLKR